MTPHEPVGLLIDRSPEMVLGVLAINESRRRRRLIPNIQMHVIIC
ncbi:hypothetical protein ACEQPO_02455 [Bacillus sp. SL00103]